MKSRSVVVCNRMDKGWREIWPGIMRWSDPEFPNVILFIIRPACLLTSQGRLKDLKSIKGNIWNEDKRAAIN